jgi:hypothetical protein
VTSSSPPSAVLCTVTQTTLICGLPSRLFVTSVAGLEPMSWRAGSLSFMTRPYFRGLTCKSSPSDLLSDPMPALLATGKDGCGRRGRCEIAPAQTQICYLDIHAVSSVPAQVRDGWSVKDIGTHTVPPPGAFTLVGAERISGPSARPPGLRFRQAGPSRSSVPLGS